MKLKLNVQVPDKLSRWIHMALLDAKRASKRPDVKMDMGAWFVPATSTSSCYVCLAGAVMLQNLAAAQLIHGGCEYGPNDFERSGELEALNDVRRGDLVDAVQHFYGRPLVDTAYELLHLAEAERAFEPLRNYGPEFVRGMRYRAKLLERYGY